VTKIVEAGISRLVAAIEDPNPLVNGKGFAYLREHGVHVEVGLSASVARVLNQPFLTLMRERRPFVIMKAAISRDGYLAEAEGRRTALTSAAANRHAHALRAEVDAIGVGAGTVLTDDPQLTARGAFRERPLMRVIFDRRLRTPPNAAVLSTRSLGPVIIITSAAAAGNPALRQPLETRGAVVVAARDQTFRAALDVLAERQVESLLLEGGAGLHAAAWDEGVVDFVRLYVTPRVIGTGGVPFLPGRSVASLNLIDRHTEPLGPDTLIEGYVHGPR
jgi:diaminohydroxyphosphoribosylaminopyrimidine deaminase/5-amino-6-(5-phosphoribosylamino)uracil reductase